MRAAGRRGRVPAKKAAKGTAKKSVKKPAKKAVEPASPSASSKKSAKAATTRAAPRPDKGEGAAAVRAAIRKLRPEHRQMAERFDAIVARGVPDAKRAVKWGSPMWGVEGRGWFASFGSFKSYAKVSFFNGVVLKPMPSEGEAKLMRSINIPSLAAFDEKQMASWVKQAAAAPGWGK